MNLDFSEALKTVSDMGNNFMGRLPYIIAAVLVFLLFYAAGKGVRRLIRRLAEKRRKHFSLGLVLGRLGESRTGFTFASRRRVPCRDA